VQVPSHELVCELLRSPFPYQKKQPSKDPEFDPLPDTDIVIVFWNDGFTVFL
jgi:hypothetical protein